ncbi:MAG: hypothetical protein WDW38_011438 [Sanguina aurantia]
MANLSNLDRFPYSVAPTKRVKRVQFSVWDPDDIRKYSVAKIETSDTYERGLPKLGGTADPRMGMLERRSICPTDGSDEKTCPGYFGHIELAKPMYHCGFIKTVVRVLRCVSYHTSRILLSRDDPAWARCISAKNPEQRLRLFTGECAGRKIDAETGNPQPAYRLLQMKVMLEFPASKDEDSAAADNMERKQELSAAKALEILKRISDEDCKALGFDCRFTRPDWMIISVLPMPPLAIRPSVMMDSSARCEDDLTHKLQDIIRSNTDLRKEEANGAGQHIINQRVQLLQHHITTYIDNTIPGVPKSTQKSGKPVKSISERLKGKSGRIRGNLMGKRVDFSARTVITGDPNIGIDELGVPWSIALNLTFPETVTPFNIEKLQKLVDNGPHPPPGETGARNIIRGDGRRLSLLVGGRDEDRKLEIGNKVERHLVNGDLVLFNRQPSLHKMSMMGHRVRILPYSTFRLNLSVTTPYNCCWTSVVVDMNMHVPQTHETRAEMLNLMMVPRNIDAPGVQANTLIGIVQDTLLGCRLMTKRDTFIEKDLFMNILMNLEDWDGTVPMPVVLKPKPLWTGKQIFSMFLPDINMERTCAWHKDGDPQHMSLDDAQVLIRGGQLITGALCKRSLGPNGGGIVHLTWMEHGPDITRRFINNTQVTVNHWLLHFGMSIGIADTVADEATMGSINAIIEKAKEDVKKIIVQYQNKELEAMPGRSMMEAFETRVNAVLNKARDDAGKKAQNSVDLRNNIIKMVTAGSKGSFINISQMMGCVGQQNVEGKRIPFNFDQRTLPHFNKFDLGPESRGFVENSYLRGLTPQEFFFHAMGGREGLIDTAVKTSSTGYIQRRLVKAMEDLIVRYDGTVRNGVGDVVQFLYGEDGMDAVRIEGQMFDFLKFEDNKLRHRFMIQLDGDMAPNWLSQEDYDHLRNDLQAREIVDNEYRGLMDNLHMLRSEILTKGDGGVNLPVNLRRLVLNAQIKFGSKPHRPGPTGISPLDVIKNVQAVCDRLGVVAGEDALSIEAQKNATTMFLCLLKATLASKRVLAEYKLGETALNWLLGEVEARFNQALAHGGEAVGTVAAQSIGEPTTQMTLNTFHFAGVSAKNVTLGVPRLTEIINLAKNIKTPSLSVYLTAENARDKDAAKDIQCVLEYTTLKSITSRVEVWYDPVDAASPSGTVVGDDADLVSGYFDLGDEDLDVQRMSPWLLRIELNREMVVDKKISIAHVSQRLQEEYAELLNVMISDDNAENLIVRIRLMLGGGDKGGEDEKVTEVTLKDTLWSNLKDLKLQGVQNVTKVFIRQDKTTVVDPTSRTGYRQSEEWLLDTEGINLQEVLAFPGIDHTRTVSNDINEVMTVLGIEACRNALLKELRNVIEFDGSYVNYRHLAALCDIMTCKGHVMSITRHGINRVGNGPLAECSFEETVDILYRAATFAEKDDMRGVSSNIMMGQMAPLGTGSFDLLLDEAMLQDTFDVAVGGGYDMPNTPGRNTPGRSPGRSPSRTPGPMSPSAMLSPIASPLYGSGAFNFSPGPGGVSPGPMSPGGGGK